MAVNADKPHLWRAGVAGSVDLYNDRFIRFAPGAFSFRLDVPVGPVGGAETVNVPVDAVTRPLKV